MIQDCEDNSVNIYKWFWLWRVKWFIHSIEMPLSADGQIVYLSNLYSLCKLAEIEAPKPNATSKVWLPLKHSTYNELMVEIGKAISTIKKCNIIVVDFKPVLEINLDDYFVSNLGFNVEPDKVTKNLLDITKELMDSILNSPLKHTDYYHRQYAGLIEEAALITEALIMLALDNNA